MLPKAFSRDPLTRSVTSFPRAKPESFRSGLNRGYLHPFQSLCFTVESLRLQGDNKTGVGTSWLLMRQMKKPSEE
ncbi:hypothetical protein COLO4_15463 [Corchorus olitorius]|uniref:Uncharacterized protein n=1 Tax=Corchorus olitorius TaxID=93759 RepID=A0A1R3JN07_9ROSI|nr:hypothetical protein COLO4_15463 [Corchorus olitorius]